MELPSSLGLLLRGFDAWVLKDKPSCETATRTLRALQRAAAQVKTVREPVLSIPLMLQAERFGRPTPGGFTVGSLPTDPLLF